MQFGHFDDKAKEYVITRPDTPRPWANYLGSLDYGALITNNAGGYSFYKSALGSRFLRGPKPLHIGLLATTGALAVYQLVTSAGVI